MITITIESHTNTEEIALYGQTLQAIADLRVQQEATEDAERKDLMSRLFDELGSIREQVAAAEAKEEQRAAEDAKPAKSKKAKPAADLLPAATVTEPAPVATPEEVSAPAPEQAAPTPATAEPVVEMKLEDVRALLTSISRAGKTAEVKALLQEFGKEKLTDIDPKDYAAVVEKAKAL